MGLLFEIEPVAAVLERPHGLLEAPRIGAGGELVYSDVLAGGVWACSPQGEVRELVPKRRGVGGILPHRDGGWVVSGKDVLHAAGDGSQRVLLGDELARGYNDLHTTPAGELIAGVLRYRPLAGEPARPGQLVRLGRHGSLQVLTEQITWPNGIGHSPDGQTLYASDYSRGVVLACAPDGSELRDFCLVPRGSADGLAVDAEGGVWVALGEGGAVARFGPDGSLDELIELPAGFVSSLSFGGYERREVLISTADNEVRPELGGTLFHARSELPGLAVTPVAV
jgi:sugar lactone lactonase YvrE